MCYKRVTPSSSFITWVTTFNSLLASFEVVAPSQLSLSRALARELSPQGRPHHVLPSSPQFPEHGLGGKELVLDPLALNECIRNKVSYMISMDFVMLLIPYPLSW